MFAVEFYINGKSIGYLQGDCSYETTKELCEAYATHEFDELKEKVKHIIDKTDFDDSDFEYEIIEYELKEKRRFKPKSYSYFNEDFDVI